MGNSKSKEEVAALKSFDPDEINALKTDFARVAAFKPDPNLVDPHSLECELALGQQLCSRLFARMLEIGQLKTSVSPKNQAASSGSSMKLATLALAVKTICSSNRDDQIEFFLSVVGDEDGNVSSERLRDFFAALIQHALPNDRRDDMDLRDRLVQVSMDRAFAHGDSSSSMHRAAVEEWLQTDPEARAFFSNLLQAHFLRVPNEEGIIEEVKHKIPMLGRRSKLLRDEHLWVISGFINDNCLRRPWKRLYCSVRHGQSFSRFMSRMIFKGPTVMVIKDKAGCIFGAHAPLSWHKVMITPHLTPHLTLTLDLIKLQVRWHTDLGSYPLGPPSR